MEYTKGEILAHLKGVKQANETILNDWNLTEKKTIEIKSELNFINELLLKFDDKQKKPGEN